MRERSRTYSAHELDDVALDEQAFLGQVAEHAPAVGAVAPAHGTDGAHRAQERVAVLGIDRGTRSGSAPGRRRAPARPEMPSSGSWSRGRMSLSPPRRTRTRRCSASSTRNVAADASSAMRVPCQDATTPHSTLPTARLACTVTKVIATARARTHAGAALCVPAPRLANTPTHAAPAPNEPISASAVMFGRGDERRRDHPQERRRDHHPLQRVLASARGMLSAADDGAGAEAAEQQAEAAGAQVQLVARDDRQQRIQRARAQREVKLRSMIARIGAECRTKRRPLPMPVRSDSGTPGSAGCAPATPRTTKIMPMKNTALARNALPEPIQARQRPASAGPDGARHVHRHRAQRHRLRHVGRSTRSLMLACCAGM